MYIYIYTYTERETYVYIYIYIYIHIHVYIYIYMYVYTYRSIYPEVFAFVDSDGEDGRGSAAVSANGAEGPYYYHYYD